MVAERHSIDIETTDSITTVLHEIEEQHTPIELRRGGKVVAIVSPPEAQEPPRGSAAALLKYAGVFQDVFTDEVVEMLRAQRRVPCRRFCWE